LFVTLLVCRERQVVIVANEKEEAHWAKQEERFKLMLKRFSFLSLLWFPCLINCCVLE
jgi:hypothetical protein